MTGNGSPAAGTRDGPSGGWTVHMTRPDPRLTLFEVSLSGYREFFFVAEGDSTLSITSFDTTDESHREPQTFVFAKPYGWDSELTGDEALLQVWQAVGVQR